MGVARLVGLVVTVAAVSHQVDHGVGVEVRPVRHRQPHGRETLLGGVPVRVDDGDVVALGQVARVARRTAVGGVGGEADLVVPDDVDAAPDLVAAQTGEVQGLGHDALCREGRVAMDQDGDDQRGIPRGAAVAVQMLLGPRHPQDDRIDKLQMARVGGQRDADRAPRTKRIVAGGAVVILDVAGAAIGHPERASGLRAPPRIRRESRRRRPP